MFYWKQGLDPKLTMGLRTESYLPIPSQVGQEKVDWPHRFCLFVCLYFVCFGNPAPQTREVDLWHLGGFPFLKRRPRAVEIPVTSTP